MEEEVVEDVPRDGVGGTVTEMMGSTPPPIKVTVERQANGKYKVTGFFT